MLRVFFCLAGIALSAGPTNNVSPLTLDDGGNWVARIHTNGIARTAKLTSSRFVLLSRYSVQQGAPIGISIDHNDHGLFSYFRVTNPIYSAPPGTSYIGIGPASPMTRDAGPVSIIRNSQSLVLSSTLDHFATHCVPGTLLTVVASDVVEVDAHVRMVNGSLNESIGQFRMKFDNLDGYRMSFPRHIYDRFEEVVVSSTISDLPNIEIAFAAGTLVFFPEDYVDIDRSNGSFTLGISSSDYLTLDPLMLVDQNIRVSSDNIWNICDSL
jgi:hypothetical protein